MHWDQSSNAPISALIIEALRMSFLSVPFYMQIPTPPVAHSSIAYDLHCKSANLPAGRCTFSSNPRNISKMIGSELEDMNLLGAYLPISTLCTHMTIVTLWEMAMILLKSWHTSVDNGHFRLLLWAMGSRDANKTMTDSNAFSPSDRGLVWLCARHSSIACTSSLPLHNQ